MGISEDGTTVKLSAASLAWQVLANLVGAAVVCAFIYGRLVVVETKVDNHEQRLITAESRDGRVLEVLNEIKVGLKK